LSRHRSLRDPDRSPNDPETALEYYLSRQLEDATKVRTKAHPMAEDLYLDSSHVGSILGTWREEGHEQFDVDTWGGASTCAVWVVRRRDAGGAVPMEVS